MNDLLKRSRISRRSMLRDTGAILSLPFFESLFPARVASAAEVVKPPVRLGIFTVTGGTVLESWKPQEAGPLTKLPSILRSLEFAKDDITVISGLCHDGRSDNLNAHEHCSLLHLTGAKSVKKEGGKLFAESRSIKPPRDCSAKRRCYRRWRSG